MRAASVSRRTAETDVAVSIALDGTGKPRSPPASASSTICSSCSRATGSFDLTVKVTGDLHVDDHHTVEDTGLALGQAFLQALGDKRGIARYADIHLPMDETLSRVAVDISGRPFLVFRTTFPTEKIGTFDTELVREWFQAFAMQAGVTLHVETLYG
jgi:imidazoleglycerol-phosphate dehydratase